VPRLEACLVDAYDTIVTCDFVPLRQGVPALAGISPTAWQQEYDLVSPMLNDGSMSKAQAYRRIMGNCGVEAPDELVAATVRRDQELLLANARVFDDAIPFLTRLSDRGIKIAIVSNCDENTRDLLVELGVAALADALVLSNEVGAAKPAAQIYQDALGVLGVTAGAALFVDNNATYCEGAAALGIQAVQMVRKAREAEGVEGTAVVRSLSELEVLL